MKKNKRKFIAYLLAVLAGMVLCMTSHTETAYAAYSEYGITIRGVSYNVKNEDLTLKFSRDDGKTGLYYYVDYRGIGRDIDWNNFDITKDATYIDSNEGEVTIHDNGNNTVDICVWKSDYTFEEFTYRIHGTGRLSNAVLGDFFGEIELEDCTTLTKDEYQCMFDKGVFTCKIYNEQVKYPLRWVICQGSMGNIERWNTVYSPNYSDDWSIHIDKSGTYIFRSIMFDEEGTYGVILDETRYEYTKPDKKVPSVKNVTWSSSEVGKVKLEWPEQIENINGFGITLRRRKIGTDSWGWAGWKCAWLKWGDNCQELHDFSDKFEEGYEYRCEVQSFSNDIETYAHSDIVYSSVYNPATASQEIIENIDDVLSELGVDSIEKVTADSLHQIYDTASEEEKANIVAATKGALEELVTNELKVGMQTDANIRELVSTIEKMHGATVNVSVADEVSNLIDAQSVSLIGAGLNAADVSVPVQVQISASDVRFDSKIYKNAIPMEISLTGVTLTGEELAIPVMVSMKVPEGIDMSKLVILHHKADGCLEERISGEMLYKDYETREIRFTVTHFSPFVLAEERITNITSVQLYIGQDFKLIYKANVDGAYSSVQMRFTSPLCNRTVDGVYDTETGKYVFEFTGIGPHCLADSIDIELLCDGTVMDSRKDFSVKEYCDAFASNTAAELRMTDDEYVKFLHLMADMLEYGAEAQKYTNHNTESLANASAWVANYKTDFSAPDNPVMSSTTAVGGTKVKTVSMELTSVNRIAFKVKVATDAAVTVRITNLTTGVKDTEKILTGAGEHLVYTNAIYATGYDDVYKIELLDSAENVLHSVQFSSSAYVNQKSGDTKLGGLVKRLYAYGKSAKNFRK